MSADRRVLLFHAAELARFDRLQGGRRPDKFTRRRQVQYVRVLSAELEEFEREIRQGAARKHGWTRLQVARSREILRVELSQARRRLRLEHH